MQKYNIVQKSLRELADPQGNIIFNNDSDKPLFVLCPAPTMDYTSVIFYPPKGCYFAAADEGLKDDYQSRMVRSDDVYHGFLKWMRGEGIKKDYVPSDLFQWYTYYGGYGSRCYGEFGKKAAAMSQDWDHKINSAFIGNDHVDAMLRYWQEQLEQFQEFAFVLDDWPHGSSPDNTICALKNLNYAIDGAAYCRVHMMGGLWEGDVEAWANRHLVHIIKRLEQGERLFPNLPFPACVKVYPSFYWKNVEDNVQRERALLRSRIVALQGYPWQYRHAIHTIKELEENKTEAVEELGQEIYDGILANLRGFTDAMRRAYPVLEANPLEKATLRLVVQGIAVENVRALHAALLARGNNSAHEQGHLEHTLWEVEQLESNKSVATGIFSTRLELGQVLPNCDITFRCYGDRTSDVLFSFDAGALGYGSRAALDTWSQPVQDACRALFAQYEPQSIFCGFGYHPRMYRKTETEAGTWQEVFSIENPAT